MLLNIGSFILILLFACYYVFYLFQRIGRVGAVTSCVLAFMFSFEFGVIGSQTFDLQLIASLGIAVAFAIVVGFSFGIWFKLSAAINASLTGALGGLLGTLFGSLFYVSNLVIITADIVFIIAVYLVQKAVDWQNSNSSNKPSNKTSSKSKVKTKSGAKTQANKWPYATTYSLLASVVIVAVAVLTSQSHISFGAIGLPQSQKAVFDEDNNLQVATIKVTAAGFAPLNTEFKPFTMIKAIFIVEPSAGRGLRFISQDLNINMELQPGENKILLNNPQPGSYEFHIENSDIHGSFTVDPKK